MHKQIAHPNSAQKKYVKNIDHRTPNKLSQPELDFFIYTNKDLDRSDPQDKGARKKALQLFFAFH